MNEQNSGILDAVIESEQAHALADFSPSQLVADILNQLKERERQILTLRYGLSSDNEQHTLEAIGKQLNLTRERVRQVEKDSIRQLKKDSGAQNLNKTMDIVRRTVLDHGGIFAQAALINHLLVSDKTEKQINSLVFLLELSDHFMVLQESDKYHLSWHLSDFDINRLHTFHDAVKSIFELHGEPFNLETLKEKIQNHDIYAQDSSYYSVRVIENLLLISKHVKSNPFGEYGLHTWRVIAPRDVGDKAFLVLKHGKLPLHYTKITELINQHRFDERIAYKETVHNELIMDDRFVLVGRGIYALTEWGYKKGLVSDIIKEILAASQDPLDRNAIVEHVLKQRVVKRNTILVGLANKQLFKKVGKNKYTVV